MGIAIPLPNGLGQSVIVNGVLFACKNRICFRLETMLEVPDDFT